MKFSLKNLKTFEKLRQSRPQQVELIGSWNFQKFSFSSNITSADLKL